MRYFYFNTPSDTSKYSNTSKLCWSWGLVGDFTHTFWDCSKLQEFWKNVQKEMKKILGMNLEMNPALFILGILPDNMMDKNLNNLLRILLLIGKKNYNGLMVESGTPQHSAMEGQG